MAETKLLAQAKIPCPETGITVKRTMCDICSPGPQCGVDAYVKDGVIIKLEGTAGFPSNNGKLCTKGAAGRQYLYRSDRIKTPMRRVGERGSGEFEPVSWGEALDECAKSLLKIRAGHGASSAVFLTGYSKWYRPWLQRLAHSFGSVNYLSESSACNRAEVMSYKSIFGQVMTGDIPNARLIVAWGTNGPIISHPLGRALFDFKERGGKVIVIDPRMTHSAQRLADFYLRPRAGTDAALAHAMARHILTSGKHDRTFIQKYVHGFEEYRDYVETFTPERAEEITAVPANDILAVADMFADAGRALVLPSNALTHRVNGYNAHRAVLSLMVITGQVDRAGTFIPECDTFCHSDGGFTSLEKQFVHETKPKDGPPAVGTLKFPLWADMIDEGQAMDLARQIVTGDPYPLRAAVCFGVNHRMYPESRRFLRALDSLDFILATDIFWTDTCRHADIVLPVSTSYERSEVKCYAGKFINYTRPAIAPVHDNMDDVAVITQLARRMKLGDALLASGYEECVKYIFSTSGITDWEAVKNAKLPVAAPAARSHHYGEYLSGPRKTPTGKIELYSQAVARHAHVGLNPLPEYSPADAEDDPEKYPFTLITGARLPHTIHSRGHQVPWLRALRPDPAADISPADARRLGIAHGDKIEIKTQVGEIVVKANITELAGTGQVHFIHGYSEANANDLIPMDRLDPYTGFPAYNQVRCALRKVEGGE